jgi:hypothetical protein
MSNNQKGKENLMPNYDKVYHKVPYNTGRGSKAVNPGAVGQLGSRQGNHVMEDGKTSYTGEKWAGGPSFQKTPFGNEVAVNTKCGPGGSRTVYGKSGMQGTHGAVNPGNAPSKSHDILSDFGPDYRGRGSR